jgi:hypothetical protein
VSLSLSLTLAVLGPDARHCLRVLQQSQLSSLWPVGLVRERVGTKGMRTRERGNEGNEETGGKQGKKDME